MVMNNREILATNVRSLMKHASIKSQAELAGATGISQTQISNILHQRKSTSVDLLERLANGFDCERWLLLAPVTFLKEFGHTDFQPLLRCYVRLSLSSQKAVWELTHELYEANNPNRLLD